MPDHQKHTNPPIIPATRWKRIAETPLTGNPVVDAGIIEELRTALRLACAHIEQARIDATTEANITQERLRRWESRVESLEKKNQRLKEHCVLTDREANQLLRSI